MTENEDNREPMADGIQHLSGTLYKVNLAVINVAEKPDPDDEPAADYQWSNLRYMTTDEEGTLGRGFGRHDTARLRDSIRDEGLYYPLICRWITKDGFRTVQLVDGERRYRSIDWLAKKGEKCKNLETGQFEPGGELYEAVECRVFDAPTDKDCLKLAYKSGTCRVDFGNEADINLVRELRSKNWTDDDILDATGQKPEWLKDIDHIIDKLADDEQTLAAYCQGALTKAAVLGLADVDNVDVRHEALEQCLQYAEDDAKQKIHKIERQVIRTKGVVEIAKAKHAEATFTHDAEGVKEADTELQVATRSLEQKEKEKEDVRPVVTGRHARRARSKVGAGNGAGPKMLREAKVRECYLLPLEAAIKNLGNDEDDKFLAPVEVLRAFRELIKGVLDGEQEPMKLFRKYGKRLVAAPPEE